MEKKKTILQNKDGNILYRILQIGNAVYQGREKIYCKCGIFIDVFSSIKKGRYLSTHHAIKCKKCGRINAIIESEIS